MNVATAVACDLAPATMVPKEEVRPLIQFSDVGEELHGTTTAYTPLPALAMVVVYPERSDHAALPPVVTLFKNEKNCGNKTFLQANKMLLSHSHVKRQKTTAKGLIHTLNAPGAKAHLTVISTCTKSPWYPSAWDKQPGAHFIFPDNTDDYCDTRFPLECNVVYVDAKGSETKPGNFTNLGLVTIDDFGRSDIILPFHFGCPS